MFFKVLNWVNLLHKTNHSALAAKATETSSGQKNGKIPLRSARSVAALVDFARHPVEFLGDAVSGWYDGMTKEEREQKEAVENRKRVLYITLRDVSLTVVHSIPIDNCTDSNSARQPTLKIGRMQLWNWMSWKTITHGRKILNLQTTTQRKSRIV